MAYEEIYNKLATSTKYGGKLTEAQLHKCAELYTTGYSWVDEAYLFDTYIPMMYNPNEGCSAPQYVMPDGSLQAAPDYC